MKTITLFKANNIANSKEISYEEIYAGFKVSEYFKTNYHHASFDYCLRVFIGDKDGLKSTYDEKDFTDLFYIVGICLKKKNL